MTFWHQVCPYRPEKGLIGSTFFSCIGHGHAWPLAWHLLQADVLQEAEEEEEEESSLSQALEGVHVGDEVASAARQLSKKQQALVGCSRSILSLCGTGHTVAVN